MIATGQCGQASPIPGPLAGLQERDGIRQAKGAGYGLAAFLRLVVGRAAHPNIGGALGVFPVMADKVFKALDTHGATGIPPLLLAPS